MVLAEWMDTTSCLSHLTNFEKATDVPYIRRNVLSLVGICMIESNYGSIGNVSGTTIVPYF